LLSTRAWAPGKPAPPPLPAPKRAPDKPAPPPPYRAQPGQALISLFAEEDEALVLAAWSGLDAVAAAIPKEDAPAHVAAAKDAVLGAKEKVGPRRRRPRTRGAAGRRSSRGACALQQPHSRPVCCR
jgi:hypothetical protein